MNILNTICTVLTVIFAAALLLLVVQILYVLWRHRRFRGRSLSSSAGVEFSGDSFFSPQQPSKELLYFFCWKNQASRVEPAASAPPLPHAATPSEAEVEEMLKWNGMYGPPRGLFTIREEEREEIETPQLLNNNIIINISDNNNNSNDPVDEEDEMRGSEVVLEEDMEAVAAEVASFIEVAEEATPFDTPCGSPPYYTPSPSPPRNGIQRYPSGDHDDDVVSGDGNINEVSSVGVEIDSTENLSGTPEKSTAEV